MDFDLQKAVALLSDLLILKSAQLATEDRTRVDAILDEIIDAAFKDVERLTVDWAKAKADLAVRMAAAEEQARLDVIAEEERAAREAAQEELDQVERTERSIAGVS